MLHHQNFVNQILIQPLDLLRRGVTPRLIHRHLCQTAVGLVLSHQRAAQSKPKRHHDHDGSHADHHTEHRQNRSHFSFPKITAAHPQQIKKFHFDPQSKPRSYTVFSLIQLLLQLRKFSRLGCRCTFLFSQL